MYNNPINSECSVPQPEGSVTKGLDLILNQQGEIMDLITPLLNKLFGEDFQNEFKFQDTQPTSPIPTTITAVICNNNTIREMLANIDRIL